MQISIVNYKTVQEESHSLRIDADFFRTEYLNIQNILKSKHSKKLLDYKVQIQHPSEIKREYKDDGILFLRAQNVRPLQIDIESNPVYISREDARILEGNSVNKKDILLTRSGANFGQCAIFLNNQQAIASSHTFIIKSGELNPFFLVVFLNTSFGRKLIDKGMYGGSQPEVAPFFLYQIPLPVFKTVPNLIEDIYQLSQKYTDQSKRLYFQAERLLLSVLGLTNWQQPKQQLTFVKKYSSVKSAERMDAEHFQPKYEEIVNAIRSYSGGWDTLGNLCNLVGHPSNPPYAEEDNKYKTFIVSQKHLGDYCLSDEYWKANDAKYTTNEFLEKNQQFILQKEDLVLYTVGGAPHIGKANIIFDTNIQATIGSFVTLVRANKSMVNPFYLLIFLNSPIGYLLTNKFQRGMVQQYIYPQDLIKTVVPLIPDKIQAQIQRKVIESFNLRRQSKQLLETAKEAVEIAIVKNEKAAEKHIASKLAALKIKL